MAGRLEGRVALVTGSGRGIGQAVAHRLAADGAAVVVNDIDAAVGDAAASAVKDRGGRATAVNGDVTAADFPDRIVAAAATAFGTPDIVVLNAGYTWDAVIQKLTDEQLDAMLDVHLKAPIRLLRALAEPWRIAAKADVAAARESRRRKVVTVSSIAGLYGNPGQVAYGSAKAALSGLTRTLAKEWGRYGVTVNGVAFGLIGTRLAQALGEGGDAGDGRVNVGGREVKVGLHADTLARLNALIPLGRPGTVEEAAGAVAFFCSADSDYVSGQTLVVGGGLLV